MCVEKVSLFHYVPVSKDINAKAEPGNHSRSSYLASLPS